MRWPRPSPRGSPRRRSATRATKPRAWARWSPARSRRRALQGHRAARRRASSFAAALRRPSLTASMARIGIRCADAAQLDAPRRRERCTTSRCSARSRRSCPIERRGGGVRAGRRAAAARWWRRCLAAIVAVPRARRQRTRPATRSRPGRRLRHRRRAHRPRHRHAAMPSRRPRPRRQRRGARRALRACGFYHQRVAVQGSTELLAALQAKAAPLH